MLNLDKTSLAGLKKIGKEIKVKGFSTMKKGDLLDAIFTAVENDESLEPVVAELAEQIAAEAPVKTSANPSLGITELTYQGKTQSIKAWADEIGLARPALYDRINRHGWSVEEALTIPKGGRRKAAKVEEPEADEE